MEWLGVLCALCALCFETSYFFTGSVGLTDRVRPLGTSRLRADEFEARLKAAPRFERARRSRPWAISATTGCGTETAAASVSRSTTDCVPSSARTRRWCREFSDVASATNSPGNFSIDCWAWKPTASSSLSGAATSNRTVHNRRLITRSRARSTRRGSCGPRRRRRCTACR